MDVVHSMLIRGIYWNHGETREGSMTERSISYCRDMIKQSVNLSQSIKEQRIMSTLYLTIEWHLILFAFA